MDCDGFLSSVSLQPHFSKFCSLYGCGLGLASKQIPMKFTKVRQQPHSEHQRKVRYYCGSHRLSWIFRLSTTGVGQQMGPQQPELPSNLLCFSKKYWSRFVCSSRVRCATPSTGYLLIEVAGLESMRKRQRFKFGLIGSSSFPKFQIFAGSYLIFLLSNLMAIFPSQLPPLLTSNTRLRSRSVQPVPTIGKNPSLQ